jgi:hypothetical protein
LTEIVHIQLAKMAYFFVFRIVSSVHLGNANETETDPRLAELLDEVDQLFKGPIDNKEAAYNLLLELDDEACCHHNKYVCINIKMGVFGYK